MATEWELARVTAAVRKYARFLLEDRNVNGVGVSFRITDGVVTDQLCMRIFVTRKLPREALPIGDRLPAFFAARPCWIRGPRPRAVPARRPTSAVAPRRGAA